MLCNKLIKFVFIISISFLCCCSSAKEQFQDIDITKEVSPLKVSILEEVFDGESLYLRIKLDIFAIWDASCISFKVDSLKNGKMVDEKLFILKDIIEKDKLVDDAIYPGSYIFDLISPLNGGSDYRLKVNWKIEESKEQVNDNKIDISNLRTKTYSECDDSSCSEMMRINAELNNFSKDPISDIVTQLIFTNNEGQNFVQNFPLEGVILYPDQKQDIQLDIDLSDNQELKDCKFDLRIDSFQ